MLSAVIFIATFNMISNKKIRKQEICKDKDTLLILNSCKQMINIKGYILEI